MKNLKNQKTNSKFDVATTEITALSTIVTACVNYTTWAEASVLLGETECC